MKTPHNIRRLAGYFNRSIDGAWVPCDIKKSEIKMIAGSDALTIETHLHRWEKSGNILIRTRYSEASDDETCITLIKSRPNWDFTLNNEFD